jgi:hypothetical protein
MNAFNMAEDSAWLLQFKRRGGRWVLALNRRPRNWQVIAEWAAVTLLACTVLVCGAIIVLCQERPIFQVQSQEFADEAVNAIAPSWNMEALFSRASPDFTRAASDDFYAYFRHLPAVASGARNEGCRGIAAVQPMAFYSPVTAQYYCELHSKQGRALVALSLSRDLGDWKITGFYVSPLRVLSR